MCEVYPMSFLHLLCLFSMTVSVLVVQWESDTWKQDPRSGILGGKCPK